MSDFRCKSTVRKLRRLYTVHDALSDRYRCLANGRRERIATERFEMGRIASTLFDAWVESGYVEFENFLRANGMEDRMAAMIADFAFTFNEVPSLPVWQQIGYPCVAQAAQRTQDDCVRWLIDQGASVLDVMSMVRS